MVRILEAMLESLDKRLFDADYDFLMGNGLINDRIERRIIISGTSDPVPPCSPAEPE